MQSNAIHTWHTVCEGIFKGEGDTAVLQVVTLCSVARYTTP